MVGSLLLLKLLHGKKKRSSSSKSKSSSRSRSKKHDRVYQSTTCRICLKDGAVPIFENNLPDDIPEALQMFGGINVDENDEYPKYLCEPCYAILRGAIIFRKIAQQSEQELKNSSVKVSSEETEVSYKYTPDYAADDISSDTPVDDVEEVERIFYCKKCDVRFTNVTDYREHRASKEHENKRITCNLCHKSYAALYFKHHMATHRSEYMYVCDVCGKKFHLQGLFSRHRLTHFNSFPFKCPQCPYRGRFTESLKMHMRTHTGEKPYQCTECASRFVSKSNLNKHMNTHKQEYDFRCESCGRGFYTKKNLEMHITVDHVGIKDHLCNVCGKAFGYRKQMMKHQLKVHKRQKLRSGRMPLYLLTEEG